MSRKNRARLIALPPHGGKQGKIQAWLMAEGWQIGQVPDATNVAWAIGANDQVGHALIVSQPIQVPDLTVIQVSMGFDDNIRQQMEKISPQKRKQLVWDMRFELLRAGVEFNGLEYPFKQIVLFQKVYDDALTKDTFSQRTMVVKNAAIGAGWILMREFDEPLTELKSAIGFTGPVH